MELNVKRAKHDKPTVCIPPESVAEARCTQKEPIGSARCSVSTAMGNRDLDQPETSTSGISCDAVMKYGTYKIREQGGLGK